MLSISAETFSAEESLRHLGKQIGFHMRDVIYEVGRLTCNDLINSTPPLNDNMRLNRQAGKRAINSSLSSFYTDATDRLSPKTDKFRFRKRSKRNKGDKTWFDRNGVPWVKLSSGAVVKLYPDQADPSGIRIEQWHSNLRSPNTGRTPRAHRLKKNQFLVGHERFRKRLARKLYLSIGSLASGWLRAYDYLQTKAAIAKRFSIVSRVAGVGDKGFLRTAKPQGNGGIQDRVSVSGGGYIKIFNKWRYGNPKKLDALWEKVRLTRSNDMQRFMTRRLLDAAERFNKK